MVVSPFGVHVAGDFQGWDPSAMELTDTDGNMVLKAWRCFPLMSHRSSTNSKWQHWNAPNELVGGACGDMNGNRT